MHDPRRGTIRSFERADIPGVCKLFTATFRSGNKQRTDALAAAIEATYLTSPAYRPEDGSIVHVSPLGDIDGFLGVINLTLRHGERRLRAGVLSAFMAGKGASNANVGVTLIRSVLARRMDVIFSDTASRMSLDMSGPLRFSVLPMQSLEWTKIVRPVGTAAWLLGRRGRGWGRWLDAPAAALDAILPRIGVFGIDERSIARTIDRAMTLDDFVRAAPQFVASYALRPAWDGDELRWTISQAALQTKYGPLHLREVLDRGGQRAGVYLLYARKGGVATALQVLARPGREDMVVGNLIAHASRLGAVSVRGASSREAVNGLMRQRGVIYRHVMGSVVWTADKEIGETIRGGNVFLGGLVGETWARLFADAFE